MTNLFEGRGRSRAAHRRAHGALPDPSIFTASFPERWGALLKARFRDREAVAVHFGVTFQTACNWWEGTHRPTGDKVALAWAMFPDAFQIFMKAD